MFEAWPEARAAAERPYWLAFTSLETLGAARIAALITRYGSLRDAWTLCARTGHPAAPLFGPDLQQKVQALCRRHDPAEVAAAATRLGSRAIIPPEADYPESLRSLYSPPAVLYARGDYDPARFRRAVAIVGTRRPTPDGERAARMLGADLAAAGVTVVSGLALGVDAAAHAGALGVPGGYTAAVLARGTDRAAPACHYGLYAAMLASGVVLSEYPDGTEPLPGRFPARNRIISGLCAGTVIVEAPLKSGALITAEFALEQGREVCAVPGSIFAEQTQGNHLLLRDGAHPVTCAADVLDALGWDASGSGRGRRRAELPPLTVAEARLFELLGDSAETLERLIARAGLPPGDVAGIITGLELKGAARKVAGNRYVRSH